MGKTILTPHQSQFLELVGNESYLTRNFYFTGGTALAEFYLHHRLSDDIDLFSQDQEIDPLAVEVFLKKISPIMDIVTIRKSQVLGLFNYYLQFVDQTELKVDFSLPYITHPAVEAE